MLDTGTSFITIPQSLFMVFLKEITQNNEGDCVLAIELNLWLCPCKYGGLGVAG